MTKVFKVTVDGVDQTGKISDGFHSFDELYAHRIQLFIKLAEIIANFDNIKPAPSVWRSKKHWNGQEIFGGRWFVLGVYKRAGKQITYHIPIDKWEETSFAETLETAPDWDGHTPQDVLLRLEKLIV